MKLNHVLGIMTVLSGIGLAMLFIASCHQFQNVQTEVNSVFTTGTINHVTYNQSNKSSPASQPIDEPEPVIHKPESKVEASPHTPAVDIPRVYDVPLDGETQAYILQLCAENQMDPVFVLAVMKVESGFDPRAVSKTNDYGLMQINKINHSGYKKLLGITDFLDAKQGALAGIYMLWDLRENYGCDTENKMLMAYNRGIVRAKKLWAQGILSNDYTTMVAEAKKTIKKLS